MIFNDFLHITMSLKNHQDAFVKTKRTTRSGVFQMSGVMIRSLERMKRAGYTIREEWEKKTKTPRLQPVSQS